MNGIEWILKNKINSSSTFKKFDGDRKGMTIRDIQIMLAYGWEFEAEYNGYEAFFTPNSGYTVEATHQGKNYYYSTDDLDEFAEKAKLGPYNVKDIVGDMVM